MTNARRKDDAGMTKEFCDMCGRELELANYCSRYRIKVKRKWYYSGEWEEMVLCEMCKNSFKNLWESKRGVAE